MLRASRCRSTGVQGVAEWANFHTALRDWVACTAVPLSAMSQAQASVVIIAASTAAGAGTRGATLHAPTVAYRRYGGRRAVEDRP